MSERTQQIADRVHANAQRRAREKLLAALSTELRERLERAACIFSPAADEVLRRVAPINSTGVGTTPADHLRQFRFFETGWPERVQDAIARLPRSRDLEPAILVLPGIETINFADRTELVPSLPLFKIGFGEAKRALTQLWSLRAGFCGAFEVNLGSGVLIDSYGEYPALDPGPEECTYEVATWETG